MNKKNSRISNNGKNINLEKLVLVKWEMNYWPAIKSEISELEKIQYYFIDKQNSYLYLTKDKVKTYKFNNFKSRNEKLNKAFLIAEEIYNGNLDVDEVLKLIINRKLDFDVMADSLKKKAEEFNNKYNDTEFPEKMIEPIQLDNISNNIKVLKKKRNREDEEEKEIPKKKLCEVINNGDIIEIPKSILPSFLQEIFSIKSNESHHEELIFHIKKLNKNVGEKMININNSMNQISEEIQIVSKFCGRNPYTKLQIPEDYKIATDLLDTLKIYSNISCDFYELNNFLNPISKLLSLQLEDPNDFLDEKIELMKSEFLKKKQDYYENERKVKEMLSFTGRNLFKFFNSVMTDIFKIKEKDKIIKTEVIFYEKVITGDYLQIQNEILNKENFMKIEGKKELKEFLNKIVK